MSENSSRLTSPSISNRRSVHRRYCRNNGDSWNMIISSLIFFGLIMFGWLRREYVLSLIEKYGIDNEISLFRDEIRKIFSDRDQRFKIILLGVPCLLAISITRKILSFLANFIIKCAGKIIFNCIIMLFGIILGFVSGHIAIVTIAIYFLIIGFNSWLPIGAFFGYVISLSEPISHKIINSCPFITDLPLNNSFFEHNDTIRMVENCIQNYINVAFNHTKNLFRYLGDK